MARRGWVFWLVLAALAWPAAARGALGPGDVTIAATPFAQRQEVSLPVVVPSAVTVTIANVSATAQLRVDSAALQFRIGPAAVDSQYLTTAPVLPVTINASSSQSLVFRVTPKAGARVFDAVDITATVSATDLGTSASGQATASTSWKVAPQAGVTLGQPDAFTLDALRKGLSSPQSVFVAGTRLFVADTFNNRVLIWNSIPTTNQQPPDVVLGQPNFNSGTANNGGVSAGSLSVPSGVYSDGARLVVADQYNHRLLIWNKIPTTNQLPADLVLGQPDFTSNTPNNGGVGAGSLSYPTNLSSDGTRLFVADQYNHRVLIWNSIPTTSQNPADLVLGQPDFTSNTSNNGGVGTGSLNFPSSVDSDGTRLFVADRNNNRVLIWSSIPITNQRPADVVLGQPNFTSNTANNGDLGAIPLN